jgi:hypothetical protein
MVSDVQYFIPRSYWFSAGYQGSFWYLNYFYNFFCNLILNFWMWLLMAGFFFFFLVISAMGYMCSFKGVDELQENDMEKILNLLTVSELREIASMSKVCICIIFSEVLDLILFPLLHKHWFLTRASGILCCVMYWRSIAEEQYLILNTLN